MQEHCVRLLELPSPLVIPFVAKLLKIAIEHGYVSVTLIDPESIHFEVPQSDYVFQSSRASTIMRLLNARLVGLAREYGNVNVNPYSCNFDAIIEGEKGQKVRVFIELENTPDHQRFHVSVIL